MLDRRLSVFARDHRRAASVRLPWRSSSVASAASAFFHFACASAAFTSARVRRGMPLGSVLKRGHLFFGAGYQKNAAARAVMASQGILEHKKDDDRNDPDNDEDQRQAAIIPHGNVFA